ncbi:hypothetical protein CA13_57010 [Planctomycetes bacterium CA13]|uniref:Uncharacterized protein n=1 Tax=Novipirellula herctigrandis TaxID=2527986 RepID=A0A5C5ZAM2_9BACT|nr:hypothetical protein CA13_57010 [Planctomycetes bacterium CA13]
MDHKDTAAEFDELEEILSEVFRESVRVESAVQEHLGDSTLSIADIGYSRTTRHSDGPSTTQHIRETILLSDDPELELPEFTLGPKPKTVMFSLLSKLAGANNIGFDNSPEFSEHYNLFGWAEKPVRLLFNKTLRDHLGTQSTWNVIGKGNALVVFRHNDVVVGAERERFKRDGLEIVSLFQQAEESLDAIGGVRRETTANDMAATADRMGGLVGSMLARQLNKLRITRSEMEQFANQLSPRDIPIGMKRQVLGETLVLVFVGLMFVVTGLVLGTVFLFVPGDWSPLIAYLILITQPLIGGLILFFTIRYRSRKKRTLENGTLIKANVVGIKATSTSVNDQKQFKIKAEYTDHGKVVRKTFNAYGGSVDHARKCESDGQPIRILIDPKDPEHVIGLDLLLVFDE